MILHDACSGVAYFTILLLLLDMELLDMNSRMLPKLEIFTYFARLYKFMENKVLYSQTSVIEHKPFENSFIYCSLDMQIMRHINCCQHMQSFKQKKFNVIMQKALHISSHHKQSNVRCEGPCTGINPAVIESTSARVYCSC